jgi:uncharacterized protein (TIGR00730 family)
MKRICVYCGSGVGSRSEYAQAADTLGRLLAKQGIGLVYGGGNIGIMNVLARAVLGQGGQVTGVIPRDLVDRGLALRDITELRIVPTMHRRKALMARLADAFIALPGGLGTVEELLEIWTWAQLGLHRKPCGLLNTCGYFDHLIRFVEHAVAERFIEPANQTLLLTDQTPERLLEKLQSYTPPSIDKAAWALRATDGLEA